MKHLLLLCIFIISLYFSIFETAVLYGFYNSEVYRLAHNLFFQGAALLSGGILISKSSPLWRRFLGLGLLVLLPLFAFVNLKSSPKDLDKIELGLSTIHVVSYGSHATTLPNLYIDRVSKCYAIFSCMEVLFKVPDYKTYTYVKDENCIDFRVVDVNGVEKKFKFCSE